MRIAALFLCSGLAFVLSPGDARAEAHRGIVLELSGPGAKPLRRHVAKALSGSIELVPIERFHDASRDLGADPSTPDGLAEIADELELSVIVQGRVEARRRAGEVAVIEVVGPYGTVILTREIGLARGAAGIRALSRAAQSAVADAITAVEEMDSEDEEEVTARVVRVAQPARPLAAAADASPVARAANPVAMEKSAGTVVTAVTLGLRSRQAKIDLTDGTTAAHKTGAYPEIGLLMRAAPFSGSRGWSRGVFAELDAAVAAAASATIEDVGPVDSSGYRLFVGGGYSFDLGPLSLGALVGAGVDSFAIAANDVFGSSAYSFVRAGALARVPFELLGTRFDVRADFGLRPVTSTGEIGLRYWQSVTAIGYDGMASISGHTAFGLEYGLAGGFVFYGMGFRDDLGPAPPESLATLVGAVQGTDLSIQFLGTIGWRLD